MGFSAVRQAARGAVREDVELELPQEAKRAFEELRRLALVFPYSNVVIIVLNTGTKGLFN